MLLVCTLFVEYFSLQNYYLHTIFNQVSTHILTKLDKICDLTSCSFIPFQSVWLQRGKGQLQYSHGKTDFCSSTWKNLLIIHPGVAHILLQTGYRR